MNVCCDFIDKYDFYDYWDDCFIIMRKSNYMYNIYYIIFFSLGYL